ncbi:MAG: hypothetical protein H6531_04565 [Actinobacteria bacterium]|nr:hypothetical protein [Thermoleophilia bacterium]MCB9011089.1 hypothetical protein [Actinomycetota bacterium]
MLAGVAMSVVALPALAHGAAPTPVLDPYVRLPADGSVVVGSALTVDTGVWSGSPRTLAVWWERCAPSMDDCTTIAASQDYVVADQDVGSTMRARVTASNADGAREVVTAPSGVVRGRDLAVVRVATTPTVGALTVIPARRSVAVGFGRPAAFAGSVARGVAPAPDVEVRVLDPSGRVRATTRSGPDGRYGMRVPARAGGSWTLQAGETTAVVKIVVRPGIRLSRATRAVAPPGAVGLRGRILPAVTGKLVQLQYLAPGRGWRVWRQVKTGPGGRFSVHRVLAPNPAVPRFILRIRAAVPHDVGWPYRAVASRAISVRVR